MDYKKTFIKLAIDKDALKFGSFKLKSERMSPYFFNSGVFSDGKSLSIISNLFIELIKEKNIKFTNNILDLLIKAFHWPQLYLLL